MIYLLQQQCKQVTKYRTEKVKGQACKNVPWKNCYNVPDRQCKWVTSQQCQTVQKQKCYQVPDQKCENVHRRRPRQKTQRVPVYSCRNNQGIWVRQGSGTGSGTGTGTERDVEPVRASGVQPQVPSVQDTRDTIDEEIDLDEIEDIFGTENIEPIFSPRQDATTASTRNSPAKAGGIQFPDK